MGKTYSSIDENLRDFIQAQQMFFVATAPLSADGFVNLSPKGLDSLRILDRKTLAYCDLIGSGIETVAHVKENGRIVIMFCSFKGAPKIVRLHGVGEVIEHSHREFGSISEAFPAYTGLRCFVRVHCRRISDSCGFGVPLYEYKGQRSQLIDWAERKRLSSLFDYVRTNNSKSIDGLPGLDPPDVTPPW